MQYVSMMQCLYCFLLDPRPWPEGFYKIGSVHLSFCPSFLLFISFLTIGSVVCSETCHGVRGPYIVVCGRAEFFGENPQWAKMTKNGLKWLKNRVFALFKKIMSLVLSGICVKRKSLWFINILQKLYALEKSGSWVIAKNATQLMRFQYSLID